MVLMPGADFQADCTLTGMNSDDSITLVKVNEEIGASATIAENDVLTDQFLQTGRYTVEYIFNSQDNTASARLSYTSRFLSLFLL